MTTHLGRQIKKLRDHHKLSQERFGRKIGLSAKTISAYETGRIIPSYRALETITNVYETTVFGVPRKKRTKLEIKFQKLDKALQDIKSILNV